MTAGWRRLAIALGTAVLIAEPGAAQRPSGAATVPTNAAAPARYRISILTFGQGNEVFERFGHNAIRVQDAFTGTDLAYNWGMFSFDEPNFIPRFLSGDTHYWVEAFPTELLLRHYAAEDRETVEQLLALTSEQSAAVAAIIAENLLPANKYYRYDYFRDNCSTRVRDVIDRALGGSLERRFTVATTAWTYRSEAVRLTAQSGFAQAGIDIALAARADSQMTAWQAMYVPMRLRDLLRDVTLPVASGGTTPLVAEERMLYKARRAPELPERRGLSIGAWGPILGAWMLLLAPLGATTRRRTRVPAATMALLWYLLTGALGVALLGMWLGSAHVYWYRNLNLLLLSPLGLVAAVPVMLGVLRGALTPLARWLAVAVVAQALLGVVLTPFVVQRLAGPLLLLLPAHLGLAIAVWRHTRVTTEVVVVEATTAPGRTG